MSPSCPRAQGKNKRLAGLRQDAKTIWREMGRVHFACRQLQRVGGQAGGVGGVLTRADAACLQVVYRPFAHALV